MNKLTEKNFNDKLSTEQIKNGLQKIKKTQLELLRQLRGQQQHQLSSFNINQNNQNLNIASNLNSFTNSRNYFQKSQEVANTKAQLSHLKSVQDTQKQEIKIKYKKVYSELELSQKECKQLEFQKKQLSEKNRHLQRQRLKFEQQNVQLQQNLFESQLQIKKIKNQIQKYAKQKDLLQVQIQRLKIQVINSKALGEKYKRQIQEYKTNPKLNQGEQSSNQNYDKRKQTQTNFNIINVQRIINQIKKISFNHDALFDKLKQSTKISMSDLSIEDDIQLSIGKLLQYLQKQGQNNKKQLKKSLLQDEQSVIYQKVNKFDSQSFRDDVRRLQKQMMGTQIYKKQILDLKNENNQLKQKIRQMKQENQIIKDQNLESQRYKKYYQNNMKSSKVINLEMEDLKTEVQKLRFYKQRLKSEQNQRQQEFRKYKLKNKENQLKIQNFEREVSQLKRQAKILQKKLQNSEHQKDDLNQIVKQLNKLNSSQEQIVSQSHKKLRQQFNRLIESNELVIRQKQSLKAMNDGLQVQLHNLKYQKEQYQKNNSQKHQLIQRQIKQKQNLLQQLQKNSKKLGQRQLQVQNLKNKLKNQENHTMQVRQVFQKQLIQKSNQILNLRKDIENLYKESRQLNQLRFHHDRLQSVFKQEKRKHRQLNQTLDHLWAVKQTQYQNVHRILGAFKDQNEK